MSKQREALTLALEALNVSVFDFKDAWHGTTYAENKVREIQTKASDAIREALAEPIDPVREAAPDLLEALEGVLHLVHAENDGELLLVQEARAAIAKAKGEV